MAALKKKDDDMRAMEDRYKMYLEKARNVITYSYIQVITTVYILTHVEKHKFLQCVVLFFSFLFIFFYCMTAYDCPVVSDNIQFPPVLIWPEH